MPRSLETTIGIEAPPDRVWAVLMDFGSYPAWNPFVRSICGEASVGARLEIELHPPKGRPMRFKPVVQVVEPGRRFVWKGSLGVPGLFDGRHRFELEPAGATGTHLRHGEDFSGVLVPLIWGMMESNTRAGFESMNAALKQRCESGS